MAIRTATVRERVGAGAPTTPSFDEGFGVEEFLRHFETIAEAEGGVKLLRGMVLELAVRGRLSIGNDATSAIHGLPSDWHVARLDEATAWAGGSAFPKNVQGHSDRPYIFCKVSDMNLPGNERFIHGSIHTIDKITARKIQAKVHPAGTVIFPKIGGAIATNKRRILAKPGAIDNNCLGLVPKEQCETDYLMVFMQSIDMVKYQTDGPVPALNQGRIGAIEIPLPPLAEQKRIVAKVDALMALCDELEARQAKKRELGARLTNAALGALSSAEGPEELDQAWARVAESFATVVDRSEKVAAVRRAVLELAVRGRLVPRRTSEGTGAKLFVSLRSHRSELLLHRKIRGVATELVDESETFFELPEHWKWARFGDAGDWGAGATPSRQRSEYYGGEVPWFKSGELNDGFLDRAEEFVSEKALAECSLRLNAPGDVLIAMYGATIGKTAILQVPATTNQAVCACTCFAGIDNLFMVMLLRAFKPMFVRQGAGGAQPNISKEKIITTPMPLPPLAEQKRIVAKVDALMAVCDDLEARLRRTEESAAALAKAGVAAVVVG